MDLMTALVVTITAAFLIASDGTKLDGPVLDGVIVQKCSAHYAGGIALINANLHLKNSFIIGCGSINGPQFSRL